MDIEKAIRARIMLITFVYITILSLLVIGATVSPLPEDVEGMYKNIVNFTKKIIGSGKYEEVTYNILLHNAIIAVLATSPIVGFPLMLFSAYNTGIVIRVLAIKSGKDIFEILLFSLLKPHSLVEFLSYSIASTESILWSYHILKRKKYKEIHLTLLMIFLEISFLALAASLEAREIIAGISP